MYDGRHMERLGSQYDRNRYETALTEYYRRLYFPDQGTSLSVAMYDAERIRKVLPVKITAELSGTDTMIRDSLFFYQVFFLSD